MITEDRMEQLLRETFQAHEHLVDEAPVAAGPARRRPGRALAAVVAAAAIALAGVLGGVWLNERTGHLSPLVPRETHPLTPAPPTDRVLRTDAQNKAATMTLVQRALSASTRSVERLPGGTQPASAADVAGLAKLNTFIGGGDQIIRSGFFLANSSDHTALGQFLVAHPPAGFSTDGAEAGDPNGGIGGGRLLDGSWADEVFWNPGPRFVADSGSVSLLVQLTPVGDRVGIRVTAFGSWIPARPAESFLDDPVTSIDVTYRPGTPVSADRGKPPTARHTSITSASAIHRLVSSYNSMTGWPEFFHSCPYSGQDKLLSATFRTADQHLRISWVGSCYQVWEVRSAGNRVGPYLADAGLADMLVGLTK